MICEVSDSGNDVHSGREGKKYGSGSIDALGKEPTSLNLLEPKTILWLCFVTLLLLYSAPDGLDPLQLALVNICMRTHTNEHVLQLSLCGGGCMWWWFLCDVCACICVYVCVCMCVLCVCEQHGVTCTVWVGELRVCVVCIHDCPAVVHQFKAVYPQDLE